MRHNLATNSKNYENFEKAFLVLLDKHAPYKSKNIRANLKRNLRKSIMKRPQLKPKDFITNTAESLQLVNCIRKKEIL